LKINDFDGQLRTATGTSVSVQVAAAKWMKLIELNPNVSYEDVMNILVKSCTLISNAKITNRLAFPREIEDPKARIELSIELDQIRNQLNDLRSLIYTLLADLLK